jgi:flagellar hook protein FlgE
MVWFYKITGGSHNWPNGFPFYNAKPITRDIDANKEIANFITDPSVGVKEEQVTQIPRSFSLLQNYPNPFNPETKIEYSIQKSVNTKLAVYDLLGREVAVLVNEQKPAGKYQATWNASGSTSGVYFYKLQAGSYSETKKLMLLK